ncbi:MAG TPA: DUF1559 domain-containing protein [Planctomycetaceae bacterium]|nr:DUF1559 domain-containing protein [Planctomycetaceae bacterium]
MHHKKVFRRQSPHPRRGSFTDAVAVGACLLCLVAIIPVAIMYARESAREQRRTQALHHIGTAVQTYHQTWNAFPPGAGKRK